MPNIKEIVAGIEVELRAAEMREQNARKDAETILTVVQREGRSNVSGAEDARLEELKRAREAAKDEQASIKTKLARAKRI